MEHLSPTIGMSFDPHEMSVSIFDTAFKAWTRICQTKSSTFTTATWRFILVSNFALNSNIITSSRFMMVTRSMMVMAASVTWRSMRRWRRRMMRMVTSTATTFMTTWGRGGTFAFSLELKKKIIRWYYLGIEYNVLKNLNTAFFDTMRKAMVIAENNCGNHYENIHFQTIFQQKLREINVFIK